MTAIRTQTVSTMAGAPASAAPSAAAMSADDFMAILQKYNDVTDRLRSSHEVLAREVCRLRDELHQKNRELARRERLSALGEMAAGVAHEIRNPLGGIRLYAAMLRRDVAGRASESALVQKLERGVVTLESIVGDILAFAGEIEAQPEVVPLQEVIDEVREQAAGKLEEVGASLVVEADAVDADVLFDRDQLRRALLNLVLNAIEAAGDGGTVRVSCEHRAAGASEMVKLLVADDGPGISREHLGKVFNPFFTTRHSGTGLGLSIVHRIAEANGGCVSACNGEGGGAVFTLSMKAAAQERE